MADVKINLEAVHKDFIASMTAATKSSLDLVQALEKLVGTQTKVLEIANKHVTALKDNTKATEAHNTETAKTSTTMENLGASIVRTAAAYVLMFEAAKWTFGAVRGIVTTAISDIDDFKKQTIGTAAAITNLANPALQFGKTWDEVFTRNLKETRNVFLELETLAARYFASSTDLQLAYNAFAQRGVVIRKSELEQLAQLTDLILLLTQGQQSSLQIQEEIRSLVNGTLRPTAQLSQLIKSFGLDLKAVSDEIRATQSLRPLEGLLQGAKSATGEIQLTFQAVTNGLQTVFRQLERAAGEQFFKQIVGALDHLRIFIDENGPKIASVFAVFGKVVADAILGVERFVEELVNGSAEGNSTINTFVILIAVLEQFTAVVAGTIRVVASLLRDIPAMLEAIYEAVTVPGKLFEGLGKASEILFKDLKAFGDLNIFSAVIKRAAELRFAIGEAVKSVKELKDTSGGEGFQPVFRPFTPDQEEKAAQHRLEIAVEAANKAAAKATRTATNIEISGAVERSIVALRRMFQFVDEGFADLGDGILGELQTVSASVALFIGDNAKTITQGIASNTDALFASIAQTVSANIAGNFKNLNEQIKMAEEGLERFKAQSKQSAEDIIDASIRPERAIANAAIAKAQKDVEDLRQRITQQIADAEKLLSLAQTKKREESPFPLHTTLETAGRAFDGVTIKARSTEAGIKDLRTEIEDAQKALDDQIALTNSYQDELKQLGVAALATGIDLKAFTEENQTAAKETRWHEAVAQVKALEAALANLRKISSASGMELNAQIIGLQRLVDDLKGSAVGSLTFADQAAAFEVQKQDLKLMALSADQLKIEEQARADQLTEQNKLLNEQLRTTQQIQEIQAKTSRQILAVGVDAADIRKRASEIAPRTTTETAMQGVEERRIKFTTEIASAQTGLDAMISNLNSMADQSSEAAVKLHDQIAIQQNELNIRAALGEAYLRELGILTQLKIVLDATGSAVMSTLNGLSDALLRSFSGQKTDFKSMFKGITDTLFKDAMKKPFEDIAKAAQDGFKNLASAIAPGMEATLGPAFMAGFALIASFVLGQLMGGNKSTASAANPSVGIQSSEQVRGLIGGETQIPIGMIGESLQEALVPTNLLLTRIALGVERISFAGLSPSAIESVISSAVNDAVQIQLATA